MKKKILLVTSHKFIFSNESYYSDGKIVQKSFDRYFSYAEDVLVLARSRKLTNGEIEKYDLSSRSNVEFFPLKGISWFRIFIRNFFYNAVLMWKLVAQVDLVVFRVPTLVAYMMYPVVILCRRPYAVEVVGDPFEALANATRGRWFSRPLAFFSKFFFRKLIKKSKGALYVTQFTLQAGFPTNGFVGCASNVEIQEPPIGVIENRLDRNFKNRDIRIGVIGSYFNTYKGIDVLVGAIGVLRAQGYNVVLCVLGAGEDKNIMDYARSLSIQEYVQLDGLLPKKEVLAWLDNIDIYCQPSRTEGLPRSLIEAMSRGCPCLGTRAGGIPELLTDDFLVDIDDVHGLAEKMKGLINDEGLMALASRNNFESAKVFYEGNLVKIRSEFYEKFNRELM